MALGKILVLDGIITCAEKDEYVYHEMIAHVPALVHPNPAKVLVIGGGDGGTVRELVKHPSIERIDLVEIDALVIEAASKFMPQVSSALAHTKLNIEIGDGVSYVKQNKHKKYDLVIVDSNDPVGPGLGFLPGISMQMFMICWMTMAFWLPRANPHGSTKAFFKKCLLDLMPFLERGMCIAICYTFLPIPPVCGVFRSAQKARFIQWMI